MPLASKLISKGFIRLEVQIFSSLIKEEAKQ
jgi:hypothetical protein